VEKAGRVLPSGLHCTDWIGITMGVSMELIVEVYLPISRLRSPCVQGGRRHGGGTSSRTDAAAR
jgi:hypothetical protein